MRENIETSESQTDERWMRQALSLAQKAADINEVPVGALIVKSDKVIGEGYNHTIGSNDPTGHAEISALRQAAQTESNYRIPGTTLYVTLEPCTMCLGAIIHARVSRVVFAATEPKAGVVCSHPVWQEADFFNHDIEWFGGVLQDESSQMLQDFFRKRREAKKQLRSLAQQYREN